MSRRPCWRRGSSSVPRAEWPHARLLGAEPAAARVGAAGASRLARRATAEARRCVEALRSRWSPRSPADRGSATLVIDASTKSRKAIAGEQSERKTLEAGRAATADFGAADPPNRGGYGMAGTGAGSCRNVGQSRTEAAAMEPYFDLGNYRRGTSTASTSAQTWFDRGLVWSYAFHHEEAIRCFERAVEHDPGFALAHWGIAYAIGPNYNKQWEAFDPVDLAASLEKACDEVAAARACADRAAPVERVLIGALASRYQANDVSADLAAWNADYAQAMRDVYGEHSGDLDVAALFADALMNLTPWALWDRYTGLPSEAAATLEAKEALERTLNRPGGRAHPGLVHLYVHLMEMSPFPERALPVADELRSLVPDAGHLVHMPTHIDVLCGDYKSTLESNLRAIEVNEKYVAREGRVGFYSLYHAHDRHFAIYGAMFLGRSQVALRVAAGLEASLPEELLRIEQPPMADYLEAFIPMRLHVLVRFGMWEDILALPLPDDPELYCTTTAMTHYAQGVAYAATGRMEEAEAARDAFLAGASRVPDSRYLFNNTCQDILAVAGAMLAGELEYRHGRSDAAFEHLRRAIALDDGLPYDEPWGWMQPTRHAYGALLLEQGRVDQAATVYAEDLGYEPSIPRSSWHPGNVWSLHGYHECLVRLGKPEPARIVKQQLDVALARADVSINSSCFCRMTHHAAIAKTG